MPTFSAVDYPKDIECSICLDVWTDPVECYPCRHVFCRNCIRNIKACPECRQKIQKLETPNRILLNMAKEVSVKCDSCGWTGSREATANHVCGNSGGGANVAASTTGDHRHPAAPQNPVRPVQYAQQNAYPPPPPPQHQPHAYPQPSGNYGQQQPPAAPAHHPPGGPIPTISSASSNEPWHVYGLTQMEYDQIFSIFLHFDTDNSGELDRRELQRLATWLNFAHSDRDLDNMFRQMDTDGSGTLSIEEFCTWLKYNKPDPQSLYGLSQMEYNYVLMQFHHYDENNSGELDPRQFINLCTANSYSRNAEEAMSIFNQIDSDHNGTVDLHEFLTFRARGQHTQASVAHRQYQQNTMQQGAYLGASSGAPSGHYPPQQQAPYDPYGGQQQHHQQQANGIPPPGVGGDPYYQQPPPPPQQRAAYPPPPPNLGNNTNDGLDRRSRKDSKKKNKGDKEDCSVM